MQRNRGSIQNFSNGLGTDDFSDEKTFPWTIDTGFRDGRVTVNEKASITMHLLSSSVS
jgi:hypothetical protein